MPRPLRWFLWFAAADLAAFGGVIGVAYVDYRLHQRSPLRPGEARGWL